MPSLPGKKDEVNGAKIVTGVATRAGFAQRTVGDAKIARRREK
jgi:hypothetical protein